METIKLKIIADTNLKALETIDALIPKAKIQSLKVDNGYIFSNEKVYTIEIIHHDKKT